jgi:hypothetical protein
MGPGGFACVPRALRTWRNTTERASHVRETRSVFGVLPAYLTTTLREAEFDAAKLLVPRNLTRNM